MSPERRDIVQLYLLPGLAAILPWRLCFKVFHWLANRDFLYRHEVEAAAQGIDRFKPGSANRSWRQRVRLVHLIDIADAWLSRYRSDHWIGSNVSVEGRWPESRPFIGITFHWGAGMWAVRQLHAEGCRASVLVKGIDAETWPGSGAALKYAEIRLNELSRAGGSQIVLSSPRSLFEMKRKLRDGHSVIGLVDVPIEEGQGYLTGELLGRTACFPRGLLHLALRSEVPVVVYSMGIDPHDGRRVLKISESISADNEEELLAILVAELNRLIEADSAGWHHWGGAEVFFRPLAESVN